MVARIPHLFLRSRIVLLFALSSLALAAIIAVPLLLDLRLSERTVGEERQARQTSDWQRSLEEVGEQLLTAVTPVANDPVLLSSAASDDREGMRRLLDDFVASQPELGGTRIDILGPAGQLLASTAGLAADAPMVDVARFLGEHAGEAHTVSVETGTDGKLHVVATRRFAAGGAISVGGAIEDALKAFSELERHDAFITDRNHKLLAATRAELWPQVAAAAAERTPVTRLILSDRVMSLTSGEIRNASLDRVGLLLSISDDSLRADRQSLLFVLSGGLAAVVFAVLCLFCYGHIKESLDPLIDVARTMRAVANGDIMASVEVPSRHDEVGDIVRAMEVFRQNAMELERLRLRAALQSTQQQALIRAEMARLAATLEPAAREEMMADLREIERRQSRLHAQPQPEFGDAQAVPEHDTTATAGSALATAFRQMAGRVMEQHRKLDGMLAERTRDLEIVRQALAEREHLSYLRKELEVARELQLSSLPKTFPAFPEHNEFDLFATMVPAKEVGGDFYDFSLLPDHRLALFIGDAAGKGVSAAMFIAMARSLLRSAVVRGASPGEALELANATLSVENPSLMFATAFVALLDLRSGALTYAAAGHNPPYLRSRSGAVSALKVKPAVALGIEEDWQYETSRIMLAPGDSLLMFTDGVTEAVGPNSAFFQEHRLIEVLQQAPGGAPLTLVSEVQEAVSAFSGEEAQADDITLLCLHWHGAAPSAAVTREAAGVDGAAGE